MRNGAVGAVVTVAMVFGLSLAAVENHLGAKTDAIVEESVAPLGSPGWKDSSRQPDSLALDPIRTSREIRIDPLADVGKSDWLAEHHYYMLQNSIRQGSGPTITDQLLVDEEPAPHARRILVVGDSYVWGAGVADLQAVWPDRLEEVLNVRHGIDAYTVSKLGRGGASFMDYAEWLTPEVIEQFRPELIVIGYHVNDPMPSGFERVLCAPAATCEVGNGTTFPRYRSCIEGDDGLVGRLVTGLLGRLAPNTSHWLLSRYCDTKRLAAVDGVVSEDELVKDLARNPYLPFFNEAAEKIADSAGDIPLLLAPSTGTFSSGNYRMILRNAGFTEIAVPQTDVMIGQTTRKGVSVHPADSHPGPLYTLALAEDVANAVEVALPAKRAKPSHRPGPGRLVHNYLPTSLMLMGDNEQSLSLRLPDVTTREFSRFSFPYDGVVHSVPCAAMGRPHIRVMFDTARRSGQTIRVTLLSSDEGVAAAVTGYGNQGEYLSPLKPMSAGDSLVVTVGEGGSGILLGSPRSGCEPDERGHIALPVTTIRIEVLSGE
jgi:hypothetical protein